MVIFYTCQTGGHIVHDIIRNPLVTQNAVHKWKNGTKILEFSWGHKYLKIHFKIKLEIWKNMVGRKWWALQAIDFYYEIPSTFDKKKPVKNWREDRVTNNIATNMAKILLKWKKWLIRLFLLWFIQEKHLGGNLAKVDIRLKQLPG